MRKLNVGIIGVGSIATHRHIPEYQQNELITISAYCDVVKERADEYADKFGGKSYQLYEQLLENPEIDVVSICTPNYLHAEIAIKALKSGKHVLCEKPMATTLDEAKLMIEVASKSGKQLMIAQNQRFTEAHQYARKFLQQGKLGKVYSFKTTFGHGGPESWSVDGKDSWFFDKKRAFIGAMGDLGVHKIDLMHYLLGENFVEVGAMIETSEKDADVDDNAVFILKTEHGAIGTMSAAWIYKGEEDNSTIIYGEHGILKLNTDPEYDFIFIDQNGNKEALKLGKIQTNEEQTSTGTINQFIDAIINNKNVPVDGQDGMASLMVIIKALQSAEEKKVVKI
ncbi:Gfo/Idh/MocA family oxidoreductase [Macrococcus caseolyticus]|uniref:Gfo/Idh/MocA family protein n=1 Tax=Macrococcoides caseolyticum TaxID=69966 RepID=UPI0024BBF147|nr:Gfo/Idh/MocA family oxidoreductase [Macrococcus caseolyticus]MDJ1153225.1 Gfo/Idh/MocA family oxidoreductase [Macrococcus caseolyticus]